MKKTIFVILLLACVSSIAFCQTWFQASVEHKFNKIAGLSISNELGYNINIGKIGFQPSLDYTYFSDGNQTQTLLFKCVTLMYPLHDSGVIPYVSVSAAHLTTYPDVQTAFGYSAQAGVGFELTKNAQFFFQYRYFKYETLLQGQLTQFGIMYIFGS